MTHSFQNILKSAEYREELFVSETQIKLEDLLRAQGVSRAELARRLGVTRARVTQIFSDEAKNFTLRLLLRSFMALGEEPVIISRSEYDNLLSADKSAGAPKGALADDFNVDGMASAVVAQLLKSGLGERSIDGDRSKRADANDWLSPGSNVVPMRRRANG